MTSFPNMERFLLDKSIWKCKAPWTFKAFVWTIILNRINKNEILHISHHFAPKYVYIVWFRFWIGGSFPFALSYGEIYFEIGLLKSLEGYECTLWIKLYSPHWVQRYWFLIKKQRSCDSSQFLLYFGVFDWKEILELLMILFQLLT